MINHNVLLHDLLDQNEELKTTFLDTDWIPNYAEGDLYELWIELQSKKIKYPMLWLQSGYVVSENRLSRKVKLEGLKFFVITKGSQTDLYKQRYRTTYQNIVYPLKDKIIKGFEYGKGFTISDDTKFTTFPFNDISELNAKEARYGSYATRQTSTTPDIWDALLLEFDLTIDAGCWPEYKV